MTHTQRECIVVASVLSSPEAKPGPNVCTVLAHWPYFESPEASKVAEAVTVCIRKGWATHRKTVMKLAGVYKEWTNHPMFSDHNALPLSCAESAALELIPVYRNKRIVELVGRHYQQMIDKPEKTREISLALRLALEDVA